MTIKPEDFFYKEMTKRNIGVFSEEEQYLLRKSKVIIFGLGGVGGYNAILCARMGIGSICGVDPDTFEVSNINRQMIAFSNNIDKEKSKETENYLKNINPYLNTNFITDKVTEENVYSFLRGYDVVIQALDDMPSRIIVHRAAKEMHIPCVSMSGSPPNRGFVSTFFPHGIDYETALNIETHGKQISDPKVTEFIQNIKNKRAQHSVALGSSKEWADQYCNGVSGWAITATRASLISTFSVNEVIKILLHKKPLAVAPSALIINLDHLQYPVQVITPEVGFWNAHEI